MAKYKQEVVGEDGVWTDWISPTMQGYKMCCCDCGLVHILDFRTIEVVPITKDKWTTEIVLDPTTHRAQFRIRRNNRSTAQIRRHIKGAAPTPIKE